jgi:hypothetical protein
MNTYVISAVAATVGAVFLLAIRYLILSIGKKKKEKPAPLATPAKRVEYESPAPPQYEERDDASRIEIERFLEELRIKAAGRD